MAACKFLLSILLSTTLCVYALVDASLLTQDNTADDAPSDADDLIPPGEMRNLLGTWKTFAEDRDAADDYGGREEEDDVEDRDNELEKRFGPSQFSYSRGKKSVSLESALIAARERRLSATSFHGARGKRLPPAGFYGSRGRRVPPSGFVGSRGRRVAPSGGLWSDDDKRAPPRGFHGSRGKKSSPTEELLSYMQENHIVGSPSAQSQELRTLADYLLTLQSYRIPDSGRVVPSSQLPSASKRQPPKGFHAARGKRSTTL